MPNALILDDNASNLLVLQQLLQLEGVAVTQLANPAKLEAQLDALRDIDVVFLDLEMPGMNGYEAAALIRAHPQFQRARLVAYTVHVSELNAAFDRGFDAFLGKPLNAEAFGGQLARILAGERVWYLP